MAGHRENRLARQTSPYLLQHATNPVDWRPWGPEAFAEARSLDRPILLSIGYSTCYWCHVMERESFHSEAIAAQLNQSFIPIKVDREERPDLDDAYMTATQLVTGRGGWPLTAFLEPTTLRPFWCGTYLPPEPRGGMPGFPQVLDAIAQAWSERRDDVLGQARRIADAVAEHMSRPSPVPIGVAQIEQAVAGLLSIFDRVNAGFGREPRFPQPAILSFLLDVRAGAAEDSTRAAIDEAVRATLDAISLGGIHDHAAGGFHRYAVDARWTVPHFEKMLNDNAALAEVFAVAGATFDDPWFSGVAIRTCEFIGSTMGNPDGSFAAAIDAETDGREGAGYLWTRARVLEALPRDDAEFACAVYGLDAGPNFQDPHHPSEPPRNVLFLSERPESLAGKFNLDLDEFERRIDRVNAALARARAEQPSPRIDRTAITAWNGQAIRAMARCGSILDRPDFVARAARAAAFALERSRGPAGSLIRVHRTGQERTPAFLEDHAWLARGLFALHDATREPRWLDSALDLIDQAIARFADRDGGFHDAAESHDAFVRPRSASDGASPAASAVMLHALIDASEATADRVHLDRAVAGLRSLSPEIAAAPAACASAAGALYRVLVIDAARADVLADAPGATTPRAPSPSARDFTPVQAFAGVDRLVLHPDEPAVFDLVLRIAPGYHIAAAEPGSDSLSPLRVGHVGGAGLSVYADYPPGSAWTNDPTLRIHEGSVEFQVVVERSGDWTGRPILTVSFQACSERECLAPTTLELDIALDPG